MAEEQVEQIEQVEQPEEQPEQSLDEAMGAAYDELAEQEDGAAPQPDAPQPQATQPQAPQGDPSQGDPAPPLEAPHNWSAEDREVFGQQPPHVQEWLMARHKAMEGNYTQKMQTIAPLARSFRNLESYTRQIGTTPDIYVQNVAGMEQALRSGTPEQKVETLIQLGQQYGVPLLEYATNAIKEQYGITDQQIPTDENGIPDPNYVAAQQYMEPLQQKIQALEQTLSQQQQLAQQQQQQAQQAYIGGLQSEIDTFAAAKTDQGQLAHPYFNEVRAIMGKLDQVVPAVQGETTAQRLQNLYDQATWMDAGVRAKLMTQPVNGAVPVTQPPNGAVGQPGHDPQYVNRVKQAAGSVGTGTGTASHKGETLEQTMSRVYDELNA